LVDVVLPEEQIAWPGCYYPRSPNANNVQTATG
jgi:hypothetical protein